MGGVLKTNSALDEWRDKRGRDAKRMLLELLEEQEQALLAQRLHADDYLAYVSSRQEEAYRDLQQGANVNKLQGLDRPRIFTEERLYFITGQLDRIAREKKIVNNL